MILYCILIVCILFYVSLKDFFPNWNVTIGGEGLQNLDLFFVLRAFEEGGIFIVPHLTWHGTSVFRSLPKDRPHLVASYDSGGDVEDLF